MKLNKISDNSDCFNNIHSDICSDYRPIRWTSLPLANKDIKLKFIKRRYYIKISKSGQMDDVEIVYGTKKQVSKTNQVYNFKGSAWAMPLDQSDPQVIKALDHIKNHNENNKEKIQMRKLSNLGF